MTLLYNIDVAIHCKDARSDASIRVSVGLEPPPPEPAGGRTHRHFYAGDSPPSSARAGERPCPPARTVQARAPARRPHRPGPGSDIVLPPGRCKPQVTRTRSALRFDGNPPPSPARAGERHCPPARTVQATGDSDCGPTPSDPPPSLARAWDRQCHPARAVPRDAGGPAPGDSDRAGGAAAWPPAHGRRQRARSSARPRNPSVNGTTRHSRRKVGEV